MKAVPSSPSLTVLHTPMDRRQFLFRSSLAAGSCVFCLNRAALSAGNPNASTPQLISPGCRTSKVCIAKIYLGIPHAHWPTPKLDLETERHRYEAEFKRLNTQFADVNFVGNQIISEKEQLPAIQSLCNDADGILAIHLSMGVKEILIELLKTGKPTLLFAAPYSGHEWSQFGALRNEPNGQKLECILSSDLTQLAAAVRPFRALHHLRNAKILNLTTRPPSAERLEKLTAKFGTTIQTLDLTRLLETYDKIDLKTAETETRRWIARAEKIIEPPRDEIFNSCRLALAFDQILAEEQATVLAVDCYGSMYRKLPAFPCLGFVRLNSLGLGGICESDLTSAMTYVLLQGLSGRPGFISDPTVDESIHSIILAHCLGTVKMDGPQMEPAPYRLRTIMERQEGVVPQVQMRLGQKVTQALLVDGAELLYFTGQIVAVPDTDRGCRTQITVRVDGQIEKLWQNWKHGLHRVTVYGDLTPDLKRFCRFTQVNLINEA